MIATAQDDLLPSNDLRQEKHTTECFNAMPLTLTKCHIQSDFEIRFKVKFQSHFKCHYIPKIREILSND